MAKYDEHDTNFIKSKLDGGMSLDEAMGQLEVLKGDHEFVESMIRNIQGNEQVRSVIIEVLQDYNRNMGRDD